MSPRLIRPVATIASIAACTLPLLAWAQQAGAPAPQGGASATPAASTDAEPAVRTSPSAAAVPSDAAPARATPAASTPGAVPGGKPRPAGAGGSRPAPGSRNVMDRVELEASQITGNRELPRVLYIVPWKRSDLGDLTGKPVNSLLDEVLAPVDRDVFRRETRYFDALQRSNPAGAVPAGEPAAAPAETPVSSPEK